jgi:hypothetical protein
VVSGIGILISARTTRAIHGERLTFDREQSERRVSAEIALAERKVALDRALAAWKRRTEFAEEVLADFYRAHDIIKAVRSPGSFGNEGSTRQKADWESEDDTRVLNGYFVAIERLNNRGEFFAQLHARRYRFVALFGLDAGKPYDDLFSVRSEIISAVQMLVMTHRDRDQGSLPADRRKWRGVVWEGSNPEDPIPAGLNRIVKTIENICQPVIQDLAI